MIRTLKFNGYDNCISLGSVDSVKESIKGAFTAEAWVKQDIAQEWTGFIGIIEDIHREEKGWMLGVTFDRKPSFALAPLDLMNPSDVRLKYLKADEKLETQKWYHVAGVYDGQNMRLYINGELKKTAEQPGGGPAYPDSGELVIGAYKDKAATYPFSGYISEVRLWNIARSAEQIANNKSVRLDPKEQENLVGYWPLNDGAGEKVKNWMSEDSFGQILGSAPKWTSDSYVAFGGYSPAPAPPIVKETSDSDIGDDSFKAAWESVADVDKYFIDVAEDEEFQNFVKGYQNKELEETSIMVTGLENETSYFWKVRCENSNGSSLDSDKGTIKTKASTVPAGNYALLLSEPGDFISVGDASLIKDTIKEAFTAEIWFRPSRQQRMEGYVGAIENTSDQQKGWLLGSMNKKFCFAVSGSTTQDSGDSGKLSWISAETEYEIEKWHHIAGTYDGSSMKLFVDGSLAASGTEASGAVNYPVLSSQEGDETKDARFVIGAYIDSGATYNCRGMIAECRLWSKALSEEDINNNMRIRIANKEKFPELTASWPIDKGSGTSARDLVAGFGGQIQGKAKWSDALDFFLFRSLEDVISVSAGQNHTLSLRKDGTVWACGSNLCGQLGDGSRTSKASPVLVKDKDSKYLQDIIQIAAGSFHSMALSKDGKVFVWGNNFFSQLGLDEKTADSMLALEVPKLENVKYIASLSDTCMALKEDGTVWTWGKNDAGQLGNRTSKDSIIPVQVVMGTGKLKDVKAIAGGKNHCAALTNEGKVLVWGGNYNYQLGNSLTIDSLEPIPVKDDYDEEISNITEISAGMYHTLALTEKNRDIWAWGQNNRGQLGNKESDGRFPTKVLNANEMPITGIKTVACGCYHSIALDSDSKVLVWGQNDMGQLGCLEPKESYVPLTVKDEEGEDIKATGAAGGGYHTVVIKADKTISGWGENSAGQLGTGEFDKHILGIAAHYNHKLAIKKDRSLWAWGYNGHGELGNGTKNYSNIPVRVKDSSGNGYLENIVSSAVGYYHSLALDKDGTVWAWGYNGNRQIGDNTSTDRLLPVQIKTGVKAVCCGESHSLAIDNDGIVWGWGYNGHGELGDGSTSTRSTPVKVSKLDEVTTISAGRYHCLAIDKDSTLYAWGYNGHGELGDGSTSNRTTPVQVKTGIKAAAGGYYHSVAIDNDGMVWAWGYNGHGELGNNSTSNSQTPVKVSGPDNKGYLENIVSVACGDYCSFALDKDGSVWAWGYNDKGQLGIGTTENSGIPVKVKYKDYYANLFGITEIKAKTALQDNGRIWSWGEDNYGQSGSGMGNCSTLPGLFKEVGAGWYHCLAVKDDGTLWAWGRNNYGQLGDESTTERWEPVQIKGFNNIKAVCGSSEYSLILDGDGKVWASGYNSNYSLGDGTSTTRYNFKLVSNIQNIKEIDANYITSLAVSNDGKLYTWGYNGHYKIGDGSSNSRSTPYNVLNGVNTMSSGYHHCVAVMEDGTVKSWGYSTSYCVGSSDNSSKTTPYTISGLTSIKAVSCGEQHTLTLDNNGTVWSWGYNGYGQLGDNSTSSRATPTRVKDASGSSYLENIVLIACGHYYSLAVDDKNRVWIWGNVVDRSGNVINPCKLPMQLNEIEEEGLLNGIADIKAGYGHSIILGKDGKVVTFGKNDYGQAGIGAHPLLPVKVALF